VSEWPGFTDQPSRVIVAGDWHGNIAWASHVIEEAVELLPRDEPRLILHLGDFGLWPGTSGQQYITHLSKKLEEHDVHLWFADGNHEWHDKLGRLHQDEPGPVPVDPNQRRIWHLSRGTRWEWHGRVWLALGGAGSPDWRQRVPGKSWWPEEVITPEQSAAVITAGPADVLVAHDCPRRFMPRLPDPPAWWDLTLCHESSDRLQEVTNAVQPQHVFHGHLHTYRDDVIKMPWGTVQVLGLSADGMPGNWVVLDTRSMCILR
jgi:Calcineurin-like phosphoesterase